MKKIYRLEDLDCANCAMKMERAISELPEVQSVSVNFMSQKLTLELPDESFDETLQKVLRLIRKIEPDCRVIVR